MSPDPRPLLLVEDHPGDARLFREMLRDLGHGADSVVHVESVQETLAALAARPFDIVFLDLDLPDGQGLQTLDTVLEEGHDVPLIVLTGLNDESIGTTAVERGAQDYLVKGEFHADVLARVVRYARGRHAAMAQATRESARAAAAEARLRTLEESREALEHEVAERRATQVELERTLARLQAFRSVDRAIIANSSLEPMLHVLLHEGVSLLGAEAATILLSDPQGGALCAAAHYGGDEALQAPLPTDDAALGEALRQGARTMCLDERETAQSFTRSVGMRAAGFHGYHVVPFFARDEMLGALELFGRAPFSDQDDWLEYADTLAGQAAVAIDSVRLQQGLIQANQDLTAAYDDTIDGWSRALDLRDRETEGHSRRVADLSLRLAREFGIEGEALGHLRRGALLHDIGKMGVPDAILQKPGPLNDHEWTIMRRHPTLARDLLAPIEYLRPALDIPYAHHERWDGSGYPLGLEGRAIPLAARLFAVADVYDALTSDRPYRAAWSRDRAVAYTCEQASRLFDPEVVEAFLQVRG